MRTHADPIDTIPLDVWLAFDSPDDEEASHEANIFRDDAGYRVEWYNNAVGLVSPHVFSTYAKARAFLESGGYDDYSSGDTPTGGAGQAVIIHAAGESCPEIGIVTGKAAPWHGTIPMLAVRHLSGALSGATIAHPLEELTAA